MAQETENMDGYQTQFTKENIMMLKDHINSSINTYSDEKGEKLDIFLILASLQQSAYEIIVRNFPETQEQVKQLTDQMTMISDQMLKKVDEIRAEHKTPAAAEMMAFVHSISIISEFYARRRDDVIDKLKHTVQDAADAAFEQDTPGE